eukprot:scaffold227981_cov19-Tisochrysis_lutea.AAC.1
MLCHRAVSLGSGLQQECGRRTFNQGTHEQKASYCLWNPRICLEGEEEQSSNPLISPCKCSGAAYSVEVPFVSASAYLVLEQSLHAKASVLSQEAADGSI